MQQVRQEGKASDADRPSYFSIPTAKQNIALLIVKSTMVLFVSLFFTFLSFVSGRLRLRLLLLRHRLLHLFALQLQTI
jgi:hypothetical protein